MQWFTWMQDHSNQHLFRSPVVPGAPQTLHPEMQGKRNWVGWSTEGKMKKTQRRPTPLLGLQAQDSQGEG